MRRDLRLIDHAALSAATKSSTTVCVFVFDDHLLKSIKNKNSFHVQFMYESLEHLDQELKTRGSRLIVLRGDPAQELAKLCQQIQATNLFYNRDYEPYALARDLKVEKSLAAMGVSVQSSKDHVIFEDVVKEDGSPYRVFTPYKKAWLGRFKKADLTDHFVDLRNLAPVTNPFHLNGITLKGLRDYSLKNLGFDHTDLGVFRPGSSGAQQQLASFSIENYATDRDRPDLDHTSRLSPHLRFGTLSIREFFKCALRGRSLGHQTWLNELIWREFYQMILRHFPEVEKTAFIEKYRKLKWPGKSQWLDLWQQGQTGYPIIDAGMRQLRTTGWMHNRVRMIVASFLTKDLLISWQQGEDWFRQWLIDYDLAANNGGWQWAASTGCDPQPYFRIFNPVLQSEKFDPEGIYIKKYVPELSGYDSRHIHAPWECPPLLQQEFGCLIGKDYPHPIVDHQHQKIKALKLFKN